MKKIIFKLIYLLFIVNSMIFSQNRSPYSEAGDPSGLISILPFLFIVVIFILIIKTVSKNFNITINNGLPLSNEEKANAKIDQLASQNEMTYLILGILVGGLGLFGMLGLVSYAPLIALPISAYNIWKYFKIKEAKRIITERKRNKVKETIIYENNDVNSKSQEKQKVNKFIRKNWKDVLLSNDLEEYIELFEKNKLIDLEIITELDESDLEKLGITIMGDRKKILKVFSTDDN